MPRLLFVCAILLSVEVALAQTDIPVGSWRTHNAYNKTIDLTTNGQDLIAATSSALYLYNPEQNSSEQITGLNGLSDAGISSIGYNPSEELIVVAYSNGNIDLLGNSRITNFRDLLIADIPGSKKINHVYSSNEFVYLSTDFGVLILDLQKREVKDSYFELGVDGSTITIYSSIILNDSLYLATEEGLKAGYLMDNLKDFNQWRHLGAADGLPESPVKVILSSGNDLLAAFDSDGIFAFNGLVWEDKNLLPNRNFKRGNAGQNGILLVSDSVVYEYQGNTLDSLDFELIRDPQAAVYYSNEVVIGDFENGLLLPSEQTSFYPNGPLSNEIVRLFGFENKIIALPPAYDNNFNPLRNKAGFFMLEDGQWSNYNSTGYPGTIMTPEFLDITDAMYSYSTEKLYLASFGYGLLAVDGDQFLIYDESNSSLQNDAPPGRGVFVSALEANSKVLAAVNFGVSQPFHSLSLADGQWNGQPVSFPAQNAVQIRGFENNTFWLQAANRLGGGIVVFDAENQRQLLIDNNYLPSNQVNDLAIDRDGKMWVATDRGVVYFNNAESILDQSFIDPVQPVYNGQILFRNEKLTALAVDGGNRVWMATTAGVWLFAADGFQLTVNFNTENSPLPSNNVLDIAINHQSGEVFFATDAGLVSYRSTATIASLEEPLKIFPNPVLRRQHDIVTIQGVPTNADFWITDSSGRLVYKASAEGNTATWSGLASNTNLSSGVYFIFVRTQEGDEKQIGKIALVN